MNIMALDRYSTWKYTPFCIKTTRGDASVVVFTFFNIAPVYLNSIYSSRSIDLMRNIRSSEKGSLIPSGGSFITAGC